MARPAISQPSEARAKEVRAIRYGSRLPVHLLHSSEDDRAVAIHALRPSPPGSRENGGEPCRLFAVDIPGRGFVIVTARRVCAINARTPFNDIEIELKDPLLAKDEFGHRHQGRLRTLAKEGAARSEEQVFDQLLRDRGTSARATAFHVFRGSESNLVPIKSMMLVE